MPGAGAEPVLPAVTEEIPAALAGRSRSRGAPATAGDDPGVADRAVEGGSGAATRPADRSIPTVPRRRAFLSLAAFGLSACIPLAPPAPRSPETLAREADALLAAGNATLALKLYVKALAAGRSDADILAGIGTANLVLGHENEAERYLRAALERDDAHVLTLNNLGVLLARRGQLAAAIRLFRAAFALSGAENQKIAHNLKRALAKKAENPYAPDREEGAYAILLPASG